MSHPKKENKKWFYKYIYHCHIGPRLAKFNQFYAISIIGHFWWTALTWLPMDFTDDQWNLVWFMAWCYHHQAMAWINGGHNPCFWCQMKSLATCVSLNDPWKRRIELFTVTIYRCSITNTSTVDVLMAQHYPLIRPALEGSWVHVMITVDTKFS